MRLIKQEKRLIKIFNHHARPNQILFPHLRHRYHTPNMLLSPLLLLIFCYKASTFNVQQDAFTLPKIGFRLKGNELQTKYTQSTSICARDCVRMSECSGYNYKHENGTCQLMANANLAQSEPDPEFQIVMKKVR